MCSSRFVDAAEGRVDGHRVAHRRVGENVPRVDLARLQCGDGPRRTAGHVEPDRLAGRRQGGVRQGQAQRLGRRPATWPPCRETGSRRPARRTPGSPARPPPPSVIWPCAKRAPMVWTLPASSPSLGGSVTPPGTSTHGRSCMAARAIIIAGSPLSQVATPMTPRSRRQRADQPPQDHRGVVAIGQAVHHAGGALRAAVAGIGAEAGEGDAAERLQLVRRRLHEQADFPVAGVIAERDGRAVGVADAAGRAEDQELAAAQFGRLPAHADVLRPAEQVAARRFAQHLLGQRQAAGGAGGGGLHVVKGGVGFEDGGQIGGGKGHEISRMWRRPLSAGQG